MLKYNYACMHFVLNDSWSGKLSYYEMQDNLDINVSGYSVALAEHSCNTSNTVQLHDNDTDLRSVFHINISVYWTINKHLDILDIYSKKVFNTSRKQNLRISILFDCQSIFLNIHPTESQCWDSSAAPVKNTVRVEIVIRHTLTNCLPIVTVMAQPKVY